MVNSLHGQGINRLADGLEVMGRAPDGVVEAVAVKGARNFAYAVQFHPEWRCWENPFYSAIFEAFGVACRQRRSLRLQAQDLARSRATIA
jgi:putative glutamine amidotransferase